MCTSLLLILETLPCWRRFSPVLHVAVTVIFHSGIQQLVKLASYKRIVSLKLSLPCPQKPSKGQPQIQKHFFSSKVGYKLNSSKIVVYMTDLSGLICAFEAIAHKHTAEIAQSRFIAFSPRLLLYRLLYTSPSFNMCVKTWRSDR